MDLQRLEKQIKDEVKRSRTDAEKQQIFWAFDKWHMYTIVLKMKNKEDVDFDVKRLVQAFVTRQMNIIDAETKRMEE